MSTETPGQWPTAAGDEGLTEPEPERSQPTGPVATARVQEGSGGLGRRGSAARHLLANWAETAKLCCRLGASVRRLTLKRITLLNRRVDSAAAERHARLLARHRGMTRLRDTITERRRLARTEVLLEPHTLYSATLKTFKPTLYQFHVRPSAPPASCDSQLRGWCRLDLIVDRRRVFRSGGVLGSQQDGLRAGRRRRQIPQRPSESLRIPQRPSKTITDPQRPSESFRIPQRPSKTLRDPQRPSDPQRPQRPSESLRDPQRPSKTITDPQRPSESFRIPQRPSKTLRDSQRPQRPSESL
ncbi:hypothetical protein EYF80_009729 [Liparis tanakae]|uniref:Uncharacterized protein n=1 Tax=Liparis tanakae TaxID=230148 RepID=A0A4Z2IQL3_9TELE|nr:hypothetical protein EYF80_009729 [Liparis tanakae]